MSKEGEPIDSLRLHPPYGEEADDGEDVEEGDELEVELEEPQIDSLCLAEGQCIVLNRDLFLAELYNPQLLKMGNDGELTLYWYDEDAGWTYTRVKAKERKPKVGADILKIVK